jgi:hypothetical protein
MFFTSDLLQDLYEKYDISHLVHGALEDKLGDVYEEFVVKILKNDSYLYSYNNCETTNDFQYAIFKDILDSFGFNSRSNIIRINATKDIIFRDTKGNPKTDVLMTVQTNREVFECPISVKSSSAPKVAFAEFDANTIVQEVGIDDPVIYSYLLKHQTDASAKNFTPEEKQDLTSRLQPYAHAFVKWVVTGCPSECMDIRIPKAIVKFDIDKSTHLLINFSIYSADEYVDSIMLDRHGNIRSGGFGTGLGWTYATGSKGRKIQFKG